MSSVHEVVSLDPCVPGPLIVVEIVIVESGDLV